MRSALDGGWIRYHIDVLEAVIHNFTIRTGCRGIGNRTWLDLALRSRTSTYRSARPLQRGRHRDWGHYRRMPAHAILIRHAGIRTTDVSILYEGDA